MALFIFFWFVFLFSLHFLLIFSFYNPFLLRWSFFCFDGFFVGFRFLFDFLSLGFFLRISFICSLVFFYCHYYIENEVNSRRFFWIVWGFVFSITILVFSGNFFSVILGWDGLGLISFCLIIFYINYGRLESGLLTVFRNRMGDYFMLGCFFVFFLEDSGVRGVCRGLNNFLFVFLVLGCITKRAQFPFRAWLPAAIAAPTPVSSLVHSSTLVTAGLYLLLRFNYAFLACDFLFFKVFPINYSAGRLLR